MTRRRKVTTGGREKGEAKQNKQIIKSKRSGNVRDEIEGDIWSGFVLVSCEVHGHADAAVLFGSQVETLKSV